MPFDLAVIDLDNTLYSADSGVFARMDERMTAFVARELGVDHATADDLRLRYWREYGTTLRGMMLHHGMTPEPFLKYVHDIGADELLAEDPQLDAALYRLPGRKVIHTNGIREHAECVLAALGVAHHFATIYDIRFDQYLPKPSRNTLRRIIATEGMEPRRTLVVDDMADNLEVARSLGCKTVWIAHAMEKGTWDFHVPSMHHLPEQITPAPKG